MPCCSDVDFLYLNYIDKMTEYYFKMIKKTCLFLVISSQKMQKNDILKKMSKEFIEIMYHTWITDNGNIVYRLSKPINSTERV